MPDDAAANQSHSRRLARELAFQALYMRHIGSVDRKTAIETALVRQPMAEDAAVFVDMVVSGVDSETTFLDKQIEPFLAKGWTLSRIAVSDLIVLRLAAYEMFFQPDIPPKVTISQAVDLAKRFGTAESGSFVNGVLGNLLEASPKADWIPPVLDGGDGIEADNTVELPMGQPESDEPDEPPSDDATVGSWVIKRDDPPAGT